MNVIAHDDFSVRFDIIWDTVKDDLPPLIPLLNTCLNHALTLYGQS